MHNKRDFGLVPAFPQTEQIDLQMISIYTEVMLSQDSSRKRLIKRGTHVGHFGTILYHFYSF